MMDYIIPQTKHSIKSVRAGRVGSDRLSFTGRAPASTIRHRPPRNSETPNPNAAAVTLSLEMAAYLSMGEAQRRIGDYLSRVTNAISCSDAAALASLLSVSSAPASTPLSDALAAIPDVPRLAGDRYPDLADLLVPLLRAIHFHSIQRFADAYSSFEKASKFVPHLPDSVQSIGVFEDVTYFWLQRVPAGV
jgi:hypothetical protein